MQGRAGWIVFGVVVALGLAGAPASAKRPAARDDKEANGGRDAKGRGKSVAPAGGLFAGSDKTCFVGDDGKAICWGKAEAGELGGPADANQPPMAVRGLGPVAAVSLAGHHACFLLRDGTARCFGSNRHGERGDETDADDPLGGPAVAGLTGAAQLRAAQTGHACALLQGGAMQCWGLNEDGRLGDGTRKDRAFPVDVLDVRGKIVQIALGYDHTCALLESGVVKCWGRNASGQLGEGTTWSRTAPRSVPDVRDAVEIACGDGFGCARTREGKVVCWGRRPGFDAEVVHGDESRAEPVPGIEGADLIAAGGSHACARVKGGALRCWGRNDHGQLGDDSFQDNMEAVTVKLPGPVAQVALGRGHSLVRLESGAVYAWGDNQRGQLGTSFSRKQSGLPVLIEMEQLGGARGGLAKKGARRR